VLCEYVLREYQHEFVFVTEYPSDVRPFYHVRSADNPNITKSFDLLWKWMEITTGAQREHRYDVLPRSPNRLVPQPRRSISPPHVSCEPSSNDSRRTVEGESKDGRRMTGSYPKRLPGVTLVCLPRKRCASRSPAYRPSL
jgi:hypothetical protein